MADTAEELHLLQNTWVISEQYQQEEKADKARDYESSFEKICSFNTIEDFWGYWNKLPRISDVFFDGNEKIVIRNDERNPGEGSRKYKIQSQCLFKEGVEPKYEDAQNRRGGNMRVLFGKEDHAKLSDVWETVVLSLIGESLDDGDNITGARVVDKSVPYKKQINHRIEIWFREWNDEGFRNVLKERVEGILRDNGLEGREISFYQNDYSKWK
ncbi:uncharacterized protein [Blastocystis hominis]|uniref:Eukaryotic translation initiation factor 4E n=1 Tax=Blastocystis hominis TaxID=12968 RepID=D8M432_BLAHO|nr:uncharacterized protein [Blastocystis hominis]XP_012896876.1 uncharacterized protein [Blastocystis hominis]CBK22821.2 unnamed protein product [Blastocystis hominis]CBK22828.2 unnamed protein product [Blastocystis hominis]|eukprot:XP_012896869.1 uncharacterized protein [Blastocystis hominis]